MQVTYVDKIYYNNSQFSLGYKGTELLWAEKPDYFYIENLYNGLNTITLKKNGSPTTGTDIEWSGDLATWTPVTYNADNEFLIGLPNQNQKVWFRSTTGLSSSVDDFFSLSGSEVHKAGGDARTLLDYSDPSLSETEPNCFRKLFISDINLTDISSIDLSKLTVINMSCYREMFKNCTSITQATALPATSLADYCYCNMFRGCTSLTQAPALPATTLAVECYLSMFIDCTALAQAPALPATTLAVECYRYMFYNCTSLTQAPTLPATSLADYCYNYMFYNCTSLTQAPALPATSLASYCYNSMFSGCTSLTQAPELPATSLASYCYNSMFSGCTSLTQAPELPATTLAVECYRFMFNNCTSLIYAPTVLPATQSAESCYRAMFQYCSALEYSPDIYCSPDSTSAFNYMFASCTSLREIRIHSTTWDTTNTAYWVANVAASGWLYNFAQITTIPTGNNGVPTGWSWIGEDYLYIENRTSGTNTITFSSNSTYTRPNVYYMTAGNSWARATYPKNITLNSLGERVYFLCDSGYLSNSNGAVQFTGTANHSAGGDMRTLINSRNRSLDTVPAYSFRNLFFGDTKLVDISRLDLSKLTNVSESCYYKMFYGCTGITSVPENMLPATTLAASCYSYMFHGCTGITSVPENMLPATTLAHNCYGFMFYGCTGITRAPKLPSQDLIGGLNYQYMFYGCTNLNRVEVYTRWWYNGNRSTDWLYDTAASGDFYNIGGATILTNSASGIPSGWTEHATLN